LIVSHDRAFLNSIVTDIIHFHKKQLSYHVGDLDNFLQRKAEKSLHHQRMFTKQEKTRQHLESNIEHAKQTGNLGMVASREHKLHNLGSQKTEDSKKWKWSTMGMRTVLGPVVEDKAFRFKFPVPTPLGYHGPVLQLRTVGFGYSGKKLFTDVTMDIDCTSRIAIMGRNGVGKTTLLNIIMGTEKPTSGEVIRHHNLEIAYYSQHHVQQLNLSISPVEHLMTTFGGVKEQDARQHLGSFGLHGNLALHKMSTLSGGQKARVVFATITWKQPHIIILDEPTNHLDYDTIDALTQALNTFQGGVLFVSHDQHMISTCSKQLFVVKGLKVRSYAGSFEEYKQEFEG